jgi:GntR family transcriptional regulator
LVGAVTESREGGHAGGEQEQGNCRQAQPAATAVSPRLVEQRLRVIDARRLGWCGDHNNASIVSTMFRVKVDRSEPTQLHKQVAAEIRRAIAEGEAKPGERLPPARDLAAVLGVNTNTVLRALRSLRDEGLLEFRRGRGVTVAGTAEQSAVIEQAQELVRFARKNGYRLDELIQIIRTVG